MYSNLESDFKVLFKKQYNSLCNYAYSYLKDHDDCEDIVQDVLVRFWEQKKDLIGEPNANYYLFTAVRNNCISILRKQKTKDPHIDINTLTESLGEENKNEEEINDFDPLNLINEAIAGLPPKCAEIFRYSRMEKLTYQKIADKMEISVKTVENQMGKAIKHMRDFIKDRPIWIFIFIYSIVSIYSLFHDIIV